MLSKTLRFITFKLIPIGIIFTLAIIVFGVVGERLGLMTLDDFVDNLKVRFEDALNIEQNDETEDNEIIDTTPLEVSIQSKERKILEDTTAITLFSNKEIYVENSDKFTLHEISKNPYVYALEINNIGIGTANLKVQINDKSGQSATIIIPIERISSLLPFGRNSIEDWKDSVYVSPQAFEAGDARALAIKVDNKHKLIDDYEPESLVNISTDLLLYANQADLMVEEEAGEALRSMVLDLQNQTGKTLTILSGYRSFNNQVNTYAQNVSAYGETEANKISAKPGFSEHQLGTTVDFYSPDTGDEIFSKKFNETVAGKWLLENAHNYGFVQTLPEGSEQLTGFQHEPWHWRYIGRDNAKALKESGLIFYEWEP